MTSSPVNLIAFLSDPPPPLNWARDTVLIQHVARFGCLAAASAFGRRLCQARFGAHATQGRIVANRQPAAKRVRS